MNHYSALDLKSSMIITVSQNTNFWPEILDILHVLQNQVHLITVESWRTLDEGEYCIVTFAERIQKLALWGIFPSLQPEEGSQKRFSIWLKTCWGKWIKFILFFVKWLTWVGKIEDLGSASVRNDSSDWGIGVIPP